MAAKLSDVVDKMSGANLQMEGHVDMPSQSAKDLWELEALGSSPSHVMSWSPARRLLTSHPNTKHCLEICVTLTEEFGPCPHPLIPGHHPWWKICCMTLGPDSP